MNLHSRLLLIGCFILLLQLFLGYGFYRYLVYPKIELLEKNLVEKNLHRNLELLQRELFHLEHSTQLFAALPLIQNILNKSLQSKLSDARLHELLVQQELNLMYILDNHNKVCWSDLIDLNTQQNYPDQSFLSTLWDNKRSFFEHNSIQSKQAGLYNSPLGPMLIVSTPIITSSTPFIVEGMLLVGKIITPEMLQLLQSLSFTNVKIWPLQGATLNEKQLEIIHRIQQSDLDYLIENVGDTARGYMSLPDLSEKSTLLLSITEPRPFVMLAEFGLLKIGGLLIACELLFFMASILAVRFYFVVPANKLIHSLNTAPESWHPPLIKMKSLSEMHFLLKALTHFILKVESHARHETNEAFRQGVYQTRLDLYQGLEEALLPLAEGIQWLEKKLAKLPINDIEWIIAQSKTGQISIEDLQDYIDKLQVISAKLQRFQKDTRFKFYAIHSKTLRNSAILRAQARNKGAIRKFNRILTLNREEGNAMGGS